MGTGINWMAAIPQKAGDWGMNVEDDLPKTANVGKGMASAFHKVAQLPNHWQNLNHIHKPSSQEVWKIYLPTFQSV